MNIFVTDLDPEICAVHHCDIHLRKMILETAQLLSTAHFVTHGDSPAYKATHVNHPCSIWIRASFDNYEWGLSLFESLLDEFKFRFGKSHAAEIHVENLIVVPDLPRIGRTNFALAMPAEFKTNDACWSYQTYLRDKFQEWEKRERPIYAQYTGRERPAFLWA